MHELVAMANIRVGFTMICKRVLISLLFLAFLPESVSANQEVRLDEAAIYDVLANKRVKGEGFEQSFGDPRGHENASTTYWEGTNASFGRWKVEGNKYCSQWPPNEFWGCYKVLRSNQNGKVNIIWIDVNGRRFEGVLMDK